MAKYDPEYEMLRRAGHFVWKYGKKYMPKPRPIWSKAAAGERAAYGRAAKGAWKGFKNAAKGIYKAERRMFGYDKNASGKRGRPFEKTMPNKRRRSKTPRAKRRGRPSKRKSFNVTTYAGTSNIRRGRVPRKLPFNTAGALIHFEKAGIVTQNGDQDLPAVIGHSTWYYRYLMESFCIAIVRKLLRQAGVHVHTVYDELAREEVTETVSPGDLRYSYSLEETSDPTVVTIDIGTNSTVQNLADKFRISLEGLLNSATDNAYRIKLYFIELVGADNDSLRHSRLSAGDARVTWMSTSHLRIQNRTLASNVAGDENAESMLHVTNNPLVGKVYDHTANGLSIKTQTDYNVGGTYRGFGPDPTTGIIVPNLTTFGTRDQDRMQHPVSAHFFIGRVRENRIKIDPGQIKHSYLKSQKSMALNSFMYFMFNLIKSRGQGLGHAYIKQGLCRVMMIEKQMDTDSADEPEIALGYEINNTVGCYISTKPAYMDTLQLRI